MSSPTADKILARVAKRIVPTQSEREKMMRLSEKFVKQVDEVLREAGLEAEVSVQGSVARDTWLRDETDLDIFARFPPGMDRREWTKKVLPAIRKGLSEYRMIERYAEHPFLEFDSERVRVNIVPCYKVDRGEWKSATDRSPFHTEYMKTHLTPALRLEVRFLRKFMKGVRTYGAEIRVGGFSGMLSETLVLHYRSFLETLQQVANWTLPIFIQLDTSESQKMNTRQQTSLVVIDPIDPERNLAAAVRPSKLWTFVAAAREFARNPGLWYFYPLQFTPKTQKQFMKKMRDSPFEIVAVSFKHPVIVVDVLWGQLMRLERSLAELFTRNDFRLGRSEVWDDEKKDSIILFEVEKPVLPTVMRREGPPVSNRTGSEAFLQHHLMKKDTVHGPWTVNDYWVVDKSRQTPHIRDLISKAIRDNSYGLVVPSELEFGFRKSWKLHEAKQVLPLTRQPQFNQTFWEFLEGKPSWLKPMSR